MVLVAGFFLLGFHTYFIKTEIDEALPTSNTTTSDEMRVLAEGTFGEVDFIHKGSGKAKLIETDEGLLLRLEDFSVTSGPDLYVYLSDSTDPKHGVGSLGQYADLGLLKATSGNQNYPIPSSASEYRTAVIWCKQFGVLFSFAVMN